MCDVCDAGRGVRVLQVQMDSALVAPAEALRAAASSDSETMEGYCGDQARIHLFLIIYYYYSLSHPDVRQANRTGEFERLVWHYLQASFAPEPRKQYLALLGVWCVYGCQWLSGAGLDPHHIQQASLEVVQSYHNHVRHEYYIEG